MRLCLATVEHLLSPLDGAYNEVASGWRHSRKLDLFPHLKQLSHDTGLKDFDPILGRVLIFNQFSILATGELSQRGAGGLTGVA